MDSDWHENANGNWVLSFGGDVEATVYATTNGQWGAVWNGAPDGRPRRMKQKCDDPETAMSSAETAIAEGKDSMRWWPSEDTWQTAKKGGFYRKFKGVFVSVKQAKSGSWYAVNAVGGLLGKGGCTAWFGTDQEARDAVDAIAAGAGGWGWVSSRAA